ncbi:interferon beta [Cavia porcellus]|uniref:interferon beta n=1 Tax=Cavia porcellus TaxID=10141 RepID=UPI002FE417F1
MASWYILQIALLLSFTTSLSLSYDLLQLQQQQQRSSLACLKLLRQVKGKPGNCHQDRIDFKFPEEILQPQQFQKEKAALVIQEMLQNVLGIFRKNISTTVWNETIVENLTDELHQQMDHLKSTILQERLEDKNMTMRDTMTTLRLKSYYWRISKYLRAKKNSICAWTVVQAELIRNFSIINRLTNYFRD